MNSPRTIAIVPWHCHDEFPHKNKKTKMTIDLEKCVLRAQIEEDTVNSGGFAQIVAKGDDAAVRNCPVCGGVQFI